ncbi:MAG: hypothetical protein ACOVO7_02030, partial [Microcystis aeruginosa]
MILNNCPPESVISYQETGDSETGDSETGDSETGDYFYLFSPHPTPHTPHPTPHTPHPTPHTP